MAKPSAWAPVVKLYTGADCTHLTTSLSFLLVGVSFQEPAPVLSPSIARIPLSGREGAEPRGGGGGAGEIGASEGRVSERAGEASGG